MPTGANASGQVRVGTPKVGGYVLSAVTGTARPADALTASNAAYKVLGLVSEDGVSRSVTSETEDVLDWNGDVVRTLITERGAEFSLTLIELNQNVLEEIYGVANVTVATGAYAFAYDGAPMPRKQYLFELKDGARTGRIEIGDGQIRLTGETPYNKGGVIAHEVTITCFLDAAGKFFHEYWADTP